MKDDEHRVASSDLSRSRARALSALPDEEVPASHEGHSEREKDDCIARVKAAMCQPSDAAGIRAAKGAIRKGGGHRHHGRVRQFREVS